MASLEQERTLKFQMKTIDPYGDAGFIENVKEKRQWYRRDGSPLPTLLPADTYHFERFTDKGWTLTPSNFIPVASDSVSLGPIEAQVLAEKARQEEEKLIAQPNAPLATDTLPQNELTLDPIPFYKKADEAPEGENNG